MARKKIRVVFYFADEVIFDLAKEWRTRERLVKWANEFFNRYGFEIDQFPFTYNERVYRKEFSLKSLDGPKATYTLDALMKKLRDIADANTKSALEELNRIKANPPSDPTEHNFRLLNIAERLKEANAQRTILLDYYSSFKINILEFRQLIFERMKKGRKFDDRVVVIFCEFENIIERFAPNLTIGETLKNEDQQGFMFIWNLIPWSDGYYTKTIILIDILTMTKRREGVLAHEIVHAAGNTTEDNQGDPNNIMVYDALFNKPPASILLLDEDKKILEAAYFVR